MDQYKKSLKIKFGILLMCSIAALLLYIVGLAAQNSIYGRDDFVKDFFEGFHLGAFLFIQAALISTMVRYIQALRNREKLKLLYIAETDERKTLIRSQIGGAGLNVALGGVAFAALLSGFYDETVFYTLLTVLFFIAFVKGILKLYYFKKY